MYLEICQTVGKAMESNGKGALFVGIDGACGTGKTTVATKICQEYKGVLLHIDDFFLPFSQRGDKEEVGSNLNKSDFMNKLLLPLAGGETASFRPYDCGSGAYGEEIIVAPGDLVIIEGVYVFLPEFRDFFCLKVFLTASWAERKRRLVARGSNLTQFEAEWIPREERYFRECAVEDCCDLRIDTTLF